MVHAGIRLPVSDTVSASVALYHDTANGLNNASGLSGRKNTMIATLAKRLSPRSLIHITSFSNRFSDGYRGEKYNVAFLELSGGASSATGISLGASHDF